MLYIAAAPSLSGGNMFYYLNGKVRLYPSLFVWTFVFVSCLANMIVKGFLHVDHL